ncbi:MAG TPA: tripartite tricarboxylate transporter substrate binding protein [Alphaproteobacteria bacterium]
MKNSFRNRTCVLAVLLAALAPSLLVMRAAKADDYPSRAVTLIVPYTPGASTDLFGRTVAGGLAEAFKQPVPVENRPGAATVVGASAVATSRPDGYTLLLAPVTTFALVPNVYKTLSYDPVKDFAPVAMVGFTDFVLVVNPSMGATTLHELIAFAKQRPPGTLSYATGGFGSPHHLMMELLLSMTGLKMQPVAYRGSVPAATDVIAGHLPLMFVDVPAVIGSIEAGKLRALGVAPAQRSKRLPDIPTIAEAGVPGYAARTWFSVVAPAGTPPPVIDKLNRTIVAYLTRPEIGAKLASMGLEAQTSTPDELARLIRSELAKWEEVVKVAGIERQ